MKLSTNHDFIYTINNNNENLWAENISDKKIILIMTALHLK